MDFLPYSQEYMLIVSIMSGMILGCIWDIYRLIRHYIKFGVIKTALGDIAYWIISVYISVKIIFDISYGNLRLFILLGFILGAILYFYGISNYILRILIFTVDWILMVIKKIINFMVYPINFLLNKIKVILYPIKLKVVKIKENSERKYKFFKFRLKKISKNRKMYYNKKKQAKRKKRNLKSKRRKELKQGDRNSKDNRIEEKNKS